MSTDHCCQHCLTPLTLTMELGELVLRCGNCQAEQIDRAYRMEREHKDRISATNDSKLE